MEGFFNIVAALLGGLFVVAVVVAWWEYLAHSSRPQLPQPEPPRPAKVDLDVGALAGSDSSERQRTLEGALQRAAADAPAWVETTPIVAPGALSAAPEAASQK